MLVKTRRVTAVLPIAVVMVILGACVERSSLARARSTSVPLVTVADDATGRLVAGVEVKVLDRMLSEVGVFTAKLGVVQLPLTLRATSPRWVLAFAKGYYIGGREWATWMQQYDIRVARIDSPSARRCACARNGRPCLRVG